MPQAKIDIYRGRQPADVPAYSIGDAARYLRIPAATVRSWVLGRDYPATEGVRTFQPVIRPAEPVTHLLSFANLLELHVLGSMRREHKVKLEAVRRAIRYLAKELGTVHPLLDQQMLTDGKTLFIERYGELVDISGDGQLAMKHVLELYLKRIERDNSGLPIRLYPFTRRNIENAPTFISIDPRVQFGKPCLAGIGVPTSIIAERFEAGESVADLAEDYGSTPQEIEEALRYESREAA